MSELNWNSGPVGRMVDLAAQRLEIPADVILGDGRVHVAARARQMVMYAACQLGISTPRIGRTLNRDHSSVVHGRDVIKGLLPSDPAMRELVADLIACGRAAGPLDPIRMRHVASLREMLAEFDQAAGEGGQHAAAVIARAGFRRMAEAIRWTLVELGEPEVAGNG